MCAWLSPCSAGLLGILGLFMSDTYRSHPKWKSFREFILSEHDNKCSVCNSNSKETEVYLPLSDTAESAFQAPWIASILCSECHEEMLGASSAFQFFWSRGDVYSLFCRMFMDEMINSPPQETSDFMEAFGRLFAAKGGIRYKKKFPHQSNWQF